MLSHSIKLEGTISAANPWTLFYALIVLGAAVWCGVILSTPMWAETGQTGVKWVTFFFSRICHQDPLRSFSWDGHAFPVCARCMGIYFGFLAGTLIYPSLQNRVANHFHWRLWIGLAAGINLLEWIVTHFHLFSRLWPRAAVGGFLGGIIALCALNGLHELFTRKGRTAS